MKRIGDPELLDFEEPIRDENAVTLASVVSRVGDRVEYEYDFGDGWVHDLALVAQHPPTPRVALPRCTDGARAGPPEDCGGVFGYEELLGILANAKHPEYRERLEWLGYKLDPERFSVTAVNRVLRDAFRPARRKR